MANSDFSVYVVNPKKKKSAKKKTSSRRKRSTKKQAKRRTPGENKTMAKKKTTRRKPAKRRAPEARPPAKRRRRRNPAPSKRRRRKNPSLGLGVTGVFNEMKNALPRLAGTLATAWAVRQFGQAGGLFGQQFTSPMMGESWGWSQYAIAGAVAMWGPKLLGKFVNAKEFQRGSVDLIIQKLVWTEGISRSAWAVKQFGNTIGIDSGTGQMYMDQGGGNYAAMQGLVEASPMDGLGSLVEASPMDGHGGHGYGHLLPAGTSAQTAATGRYTGSGYTSNYHAAFAR